MHLLQIIRIIYCSQSTSPQIWCDFDRASSLICRNKMPTRCNRGFLRSAIKTSVASSWHFISTYFPTFCNIMYVQTWISLYCTDHFYGIWYQCVQWFCHLPSSDKTEEIWRHLYPNFTLVLTWHDLDDRRSVGERTTCYSTVTLWPPPPYL